MEGWLERWMDGRMDGLMDGQSQSTPITVPTWKNDLQFVLLKRNLITDPNFTTLCVPFG